MFRYPAELRQRQEMMMRNQMAMAPQIMTQGQQRLQGVPTQFEPRFMERCVLTDCHKKHNVTGSISTMSPRESKTAMTFHWLDCFSISFPLLRELGPPSEMVSSDGRQMHMGGHLGPPLQPHANVMQGRGFPGAGKPDTNVPVVGGGLWGGSFTICYITINT